MFSGLSKEISGIKWVNQQTKENSIATSKLRKAVPNNIVNYKGTVN